jgi:hypothetical protein
MSEPVITYALPLARRRDGPYYKGRIGSGMTALLIYCLIANRRKLGIEMTIIVRTCPPRVGAHVWQNGDLR